MREDLMKMTHTELIAYCEGLGIKVTDDTRKLSKAELRDLITVVESSKEEEVLNDEATQEPTDVKDEAVESTSETPKRSVLAEEIERRKGTTAKKSAFSKELDRRKGVRVAARTFREELEHRKRRNK